MLFSYFVSVVVFPLQYLPHFIKKKKKREEKQTKTMAGKEPFTSSFSTEIPVLMTRQRGLAVMRRLQAEKKDLLDN